MDNIALWIVLGFGALLGFTWTVNSRSRKIKSKMDMNRRSESKDPRISYEVRGSNDI